MALLMRGAFSERTAGDARGDKDAAATRTTPTNGDTMFRKKENEPPRPGTAAAEPVRPAASTTFAPTPAPTPLATATPSPTPEAAAPIESKRLIVGQGIRLSGEITACDRLVVEGFVEATLNETRALEIAKSGRFIGGCEVEEAEISGVYEGELTVRSRLLVRSTGKLKGNVKYGEIEIERGAQVAGSISQLDGK